MVFYQYMNKPLTRSQIVYKIRNPNGDPFHYKVSNRILEIIGLVLWATEGDKTQVSLSNGNPNIIRKYLEFLRKICHFRENKIKAVIHCHDTLEYEQCLNYWSRVTSITRNRFTKPFIKKDKGGTRKYPYGIIRIAASNIKLVRIFKEHLRSLGLPRD